MNTAALSEKFFDFKWFAERFFSIRDAKGRVIPFRMNDLQNALYPRLIGRDDVLKARKGGVSTLFELKMFHEALLMPNYRGLVLAHEHKSAIDIFDIVKTAHDHLPDQLRPKLEIDSRQEIVLAENKSRLQAHTAKNPDLGRGGTINALHCSEIAFWGTPSKTLTAAGASLGEDAWVGRESTANGAGTYWHTEWVKGKNGRSGYRPHFFPWMIESRYQVAEPDRVLDPDEFDSDGNRIPLEFSKRERELGLNEAQARWRRRRVVEFKEKFSQEYAEDDVSCFLTTGRSIFDNVWLQKKYAALVASGAAALAERPELGLKIFKLYEDREAYLQHAFVIGADASEGLEDPTDPNEAGDYCSAYVLERWSGAQVAAVHGLWEPHEFARILAEVGYLYSTAQGPALIGVERQGGGTAVLSELHNHLHYPQLYWHDEFDDKEGKHKRRLGWHTNTATRPILVDGLVKAVIKGHMKVLDPEFLAECMTFVRNARGKPCAQVGCYDDRVMSAGIAWQMRMRTSGVPLMGTNYS